MVILREQKKKAKKVSGSLEGDTHVPEWKDGSPSVGIAVDIGTTTIALTAIELRDGKILGEYAEINEQTKLGADVMMRIMHSLSGKRELLHQMVVHQIEQMAERVLQGNILLEDIRSRRICFSVVGNTTMCHLFLNRNVEGLSGYPFKADYYGNYQCTGKEIGMELFPDAQINVLSGIAAHVGSDALAVIGAENLYGEGKTQLAIDLGTNAEIILNHRGRLSVCSTAAGPAFEGKGIQCGMPAGAGAVNGVKLSPGNGNMILEFISGDMPRGICGSGLVDAIAALRRCGVLCSDGYLMSEGEAKERKIHPEICRQLVRRNDQNAFLFYADEQREVYLQQSDIRGIQLAKGAVQAGILSLLSENGLKLCDLDEVVVAGVLGSCMRPANAVGIGLLPEISAQRLRFAGNAAGRGALRVLTDEAFLPAMERLAETIHHIELAGLSYFGEFMMRSMELQPWQ